MDVLVVRDSGKTFVVPRQVAEVVQRCFPFRSVADHARAIGQQIGAPASGIPKLEELIGELAGEGLLFDLDAQAAAAPAKTPLRTLGVITANRPALLARAVRSFAENARSFGRRIEAIVCDDGTEEHAKETGRRLEAVARETGIAIEHVDLAEKRALAADLARESGVDADVVDFALFDPLGIGSAIGANRNALTLLTAGRKILSADDDTIARPRRAPGAETTLAFDGNGDPQQLWFYPHIESALGPPEDTTVDVFGEHDALLGHPLVDLALRGPLAHEDLRGICTHMVGAFATRRGVVSVTPSGIYGDSGMHAGTMLLGLGEPTRRRLCASEEEYRSAFRSRAVLRGVSNAFVAHPFPSAGTVFGLDGTDLVPPFLPVLRNEDGVFGMTLAVVAKDAYYGFPAHALAHVPAEVRVFPDGKYLTGLAEPRGSMIVMALFMEHQPNPYTIDRAARLRALGQHLVDLAALDANDFAHAVQEAWTKNTQRGIARFEQLLELNRRQPAYWASDVERAIAIARDAMGSGSWTPSELSEGRTREEAEALTRRFVGDFGRLLLAWPALFAAARRLRGRRKAVDSARA